MAEKKKSGPTYRTIADTYLDGEVFASLSLLAKHAYVQLVMVMGGASGIDRHVLEQFYERSGFTAETAREPFDELRARGLLAIERSVVWVVDYFQRACATHVCHNPNHRTQVENYIKHHLPHQQIVNDYAEYYGFPLPYPELGTSGKWSICPEAKRFLDKGKSEANSNWFGAPSQANRGPHQIAEEVREILYVDGKQPKGDSMDMARAVVKKLLESHTADEIISVAEGLSMLRTDRRLDGTSPTQSISVRMLAERGEHWAMETVAREYLMKRIRGATEDQLDNYLDAIGSTWFLTRR